MESEATSADEGEAKGLAYCRRDIFDSFNSDEGRSMAGDCNGVYCAHVIEHLGPEKVFELFKAVKMFCAPGVRARFITNNPADLRVLGGVFWGDLTHIRLYAGVMLEGMARNQCFKHARSEVFLGAKLGKRDALRSWVERHFSGIHKWQPNLLVDCS